VVTERSSAQAGGLLGGLASIGRRGVLGAGIKPVRIKQG